MLDDASSFGRGFARVLEISRFARITSTLAVQIMETPPDEKVEVWMIIEQP